MEAIGPQIGTDAFCSREKKKRSSLPVITLVVYCGMEHPMGGAGCLHELLEIV